MALTLIGCAVVLPPPGGPDDRVPPQVEFCSIPHGLLGVGTELAIEVRFSEYIERSDVLRCIAISPRAAMNIEWNGRTLTILLDSLRKGTTYRLSIAPDYRDLRGNHATEPFSRVFSTGNYLDSCRISGTILTTDATPLYAQLIPSDTTRSTTRYIVPAARDGSFLADALPCETFFVTAFADANGNGEYDNGEKCGVAASTIVAAPTPAYVRIWLSLPPPRNPLRVLNARAITERRIRTTVSLPINRTERNHWQLTDSISRKNIPIVGTVLRDADHLDILSAEPLSEERTYILAPSANADICDTVGRALVVDTTAVTFSGKSIPDSMPLHVVQLVPPRDTTRNAPLMPSLHVLWSDAIATLPTIELFETGSDTVVPLKVERQDDAHIIAQPRDSLRPTTQYTWHIVLAAARSWRGIPSSDTNTLVRSIFTLDTRDGGSVRGIVIDSCCNCRQVIVLARNRQGGTVATARANADGRFIIGYLPEDSYQLDVFCDANANNVYDSGGLNPLQLGEHVATSPVAVSIKARWITDGVTIRLGR
ncbi:MAG: Ig-like domain-containing protein [Chlorobi bacterium]|nr:Ig-like domain-containing protein [Chlorobiota bacterium]